MGWKRSSSGVQGSGGRHRRPNRPRDDAECRGDQRERARELQTERSLPFNPEINRMSPAAIVFKKLRTSLLTMPSSSRVAPSALSASAPRRRGHDRKQRRLGRDQRQPGGTERQRPDPASVPWSDIAPGVPAIPPARRRRTMKARRPKALPISLATVSLAPAASAATKAIEAGSLARPAIASGQTSIPVAEARRPRPSR